jgi:geranylgeranyl pyrophosphate synthase
LLLLVGMGHVRNQPDSGAKGAAGSSLTAERVLAHTRPSDGHWPTGCHQARPQLAARNRENRRNATDNVAGRRWSGLLGLPSLLDDVKHVDTVIGACVDDGASLLDAVLTHVLSSGGKRMRPVLTLCAAYTAGRPLGPEATQRVAKAAAAVELVHVGTLCHDDVIDDSDLRRGRPSAKQQWTNSVAVIAGDFLLARSSALVAELGSRESRVLADALGAICRGQMLEMSQLFDISRTEDVYLESIAGKTAALLVAGCRLGAIEGGADPRSVDALETFGHHLGVLFQITDDILDIEESTEALGKPACNDLITGVYTMPTIHALREHEDLRELLGQPLTARKAAKVRDLVDAVGGVRYARSRAEWHAGAALEALGDVRVADEGALRALGGLVRFVQQQAPGARPGTRSIASQAAERL